MISKWVFFLFLFGCVMYAMVQPQSTSSIGIQCFFSTSSYSNEHIHNNGVCGWFILIFFFVQITSVFVVGVSGFWLLLLLFIRFSFSFSLLPSLPRYYCCRIVCIWKFDAAFSWRRLIKPSKTSHMCVCLSVDHWQKNVAADEIKFATVRMKKIFMWRN